MHEPDDMDVRDTVRTAGHSVPSDFRAALRDRIDGALRGETVVAVTVPPPAGRGRWLAAAAVLVIAGIVAGGVALSGDDPGTVTPATLPATSAPSPVQETTVPETTVPETTEPPTSAPTTNPEITVAPYVPLPAELTISVDSVLFQGTIRRTLASGRPHASADGAFNAAFFQDEGWTTWDRAAQTDPIVVTHFALDGSQRWRVSVPSVVQGMTQSGSIDIGPMGVLYAYYEGMQPPGLVAAVPYGGKRAGQVVGTWSVPSSCYETFCGPPLTDTGISTELGVAPFVDQTGALVEASLVIPTQPSVTLGAGAPVPDGWVQFDELGNNLSSWRTEVTFGGHSWTFDAIGVNTQEGSYLSARPQADGSVIVWFTVSDGAGNSATRTQTVVAVLQGDADPTFFGMPDDVIDVSWLPDSGLLATVYDAATKTYALAKLSLPE